MRRTSLLVLAAIALAVPAHRLHAQKVDSLMLRLAVPREAAAESVVTAFTRAGLTITNTTNMLIEADAGSTPNLLTGGEARRVVRAVLMGAPQNATNVLITGTEIRMDENKHVQQTIRLDNRAGGNGGRVWRKMVTAALALDSASVPVAARPH
jgi:hypothetical protein